MSYKEENACPKLYCPCDPDITSYPKSAAIQNKVCVMQGCLSIYLTEEQLHIHCQS